MNAAEQVVQATLAAYEQWAPKYPPVAHNPLMRAEQRAMLDLWPPTAAGCRALDLACGSGRYTRLLESAGAEVTALDFCVPMLQQISNARRVCASMMQLPFQASSFDLVVSGLAIGHATALQPWMAQVSRVLRKDGVLLYSDFHPEAARAGLTRSFKDENNNLQLVPHQSYGVAEQAAAAAAAGLAVEEIQELRIGRELHESFPGSDSIYRDWDGLPVVLVVRARK